VQTIPNSSWIEQSLDRAKQLYDEKRFSDAIELYKQILQSRPETEDAARHVRVLAHRPARSLSRRWRAR
jgi:hypothetical protein